MRVLLAGLLGCAAGAPGRDIPVYREYSQPISFYDDNGERTDFAAVAPDVTELRSVRDAQAQEALMGKETLLEMTFGKNESVFGQSSPLPGKLTPPASGRDEGRRRSDSAGQNWLVKSLALPSLGQTPTNAAASAMSAGATESSWGWLADEVVGSPGLQAALTEELRPEESLEAALEPKGSSAGGEDLRGTGGLGAAEDPARAEFGTSAADVDRERAAQGQKPSDRAKERNEASVRNLSGGDGVAASTMQSYRSSPAMADMSQTRQMIAEFSAGARPDFASLRESLLSSSAGMPGPADSAPSGAALPAFTPNQGGQTTWGSMGNRPAINSGTKGYSSPAASAWQGGWQAQSAGGGRLTQFEPVSSPASEPVIPAATPAKTRPTPSSGGYKPAWH